MGQNAQAGGAPRGLVSVDWVLLAVAIFAFAMLAGTMIRTDSGADADRGVVGLHALRDDEVLLAFQDFTFGAAGWQPSATTDRIAGLGPVLGPSPDDTLWRRFDLPDGSDAIYLAFHLHLLGDWVDAGSLSVALGEIGIVTLRVPGAEGDPGQMVDVLEGPQDGVSIAVDQVWIRPHPSEGSLPGADPAIASFQVRILLRSPSDTITLSIVGDPPDARAAWVLDNLEAVARRPDTEAAAIN